MADNDGKQQQQPTPPAKDRTKKDSSKKTADVPTIPQESKHLISFSEYRGIANRKEVTFVLEHGFRVWMKTVKQEPLRSRTFSEWDDLINEYLKS